MSTRGDATPRGRVQAVTEPLTVTDESPESLWRMLDDKGWGDGLPVVAPTPQRVDAALVAAGGDPDEVIAVLPPRSGQATRRCAFVSDEP